ncbi:DUF6233 domain-containing protein [Streptomyces sp. NPDC001194]|uniref:DUF6233 domain-containing protein n=1 Tax=Streptomyces sp. NPDC001194 TaxID=3364547 RepID=UPI00368CAD30
MSELPPDLPHLRTVVTYLRGELSRAERALNTAEEDEALAGRRRLAPGPHPRRGLLGQPKRCAPIDTDQARRALVEGIPACPHCRPDTALGMPE